MNTMKKIFEKVLHEAWGVDTATMNLLCRAGDFANRTPLAADWRTRLPRSVLYRCASVASLSPVLSLSQHAIATRLAVNAAGPNCNTAKGSMGLHAAIVRLQRIRGAQIEQLYKSKFWRLLPEPEASVFEAVIENMYLIRTILRIGSYRAIIHLWGEAAVAPDVLQRNQVRLVQKLEKMWHLVHGHMTRMFPGHLFDGKYRLNGFMTRSVGIVFELMHTRIKSGLPPFDEEVRRLLSSRTALSLCRRIIAACAVCAGARVAQRRTSRA
jgi:hypothetical protein